MAHTMEKQETESVEVRQSWPPTPSPEPARGPAPPIPNEIYNYKLVLLAVTAASAATIIGYDSGFIGGTVSLDSFKDEFGLNEMSSSKQSQISSNVVSVFQAGAYFGCLFFYPIGEVLGRRMGLFLSGFLLTFGAAISLISNSDRGLGAIYAGRVLTGLGIGGCSGLAPIYVSEISPAAIRGKLVGCWEISWQVGGVIGYWINYGVLENVAPSTKQWLIPFAIQLVPSGLFWGLTILLPESPRFLVSRGRVDQAQKNLAYLRGLSPEHPYSIYELETICTSIEENFAVTGRGFFAPLKAMFTKKHLVYRLVLSTALFMMQNGFGINAVTYYSPTIFKSIGVNGNNATLLSTGIFGVLKAVASLFWIFFLVDKLGRRACLIWICLPCTICMWYIGAYVKIENPAARLDAGETGSTAGGRAAQGLLYIWTVFYGLTWNGTPWVICSEIFPQSVRTVAQAVNASSNWFWAFIFGHFTGQALDNIGYGYYFLFGACSIVFPVVVYFIYPETKGVPLEAMDYLFQKPAWRAHGYAMKQYREHYMGESDSVKEEEILSPN
ncbi:uncharacterized protein CXQ87_002473 [Candidozyma duobushaemuli]|nr:uncharacterized protein CXQ87_002473 [[Candida] duobushaemulonis]PVH14344.1 hypothetical protein CXQ87_002473 [[Candida] duobushaemulonis]